MGTTPSVFGKSTNDYVTGVLLDYNSRAAQEAYEKSSQQDLFTYEVLPHGEYAEQGGEHNPIHLSLDPIEYKTQLDFATNDYKVFTKSENLPPNT